MVTEQLVSTEVSDEPAVPAGLNIEPPRLRRFRPLILAGRVARGVASAAEWLFGLVSLVVGLSTLAALPLLQFLSLGYFLESSARVARTGRLRDGLIGVRPAARIGGLAAAIWLSLVPAWLVGSYARSAELIDPGGPVRSQLADRSRWL